MHWNNPEKKSDYTDGSGLKLYYTPNMRTHDGGTLMIGTGYINIPPNTAHHDENGGCFKECSRHNKGTVAITGVIFHMHYLGKAI